MDMATGSEEKIVKRARRLSAGSTVRRMVDEGDSREIEKAGSKLPKEEILKNICIFKSHDHVIEAMSQFRKIGATQLIIGI
ncbi:MAG: hypothetical protein OK474_04050 [Thaumarchaeota archaeon]|nr:hypothetical protein [Nitrososphaerota archaeon]